LQGKGGIGKTVVATWLAEFLIGRGQPVCCIDGDPVNRSLAQYKALPVENLDLVNQEGVVIRSNYDRLTERFLNDDSVFVVDSGATAFSAILDIHSRIGRHHGPARSRPKGLRPYPYQRRRNA
jgi:cellulose biosynthesis protein BcsQ